jgi:hypothetical protein
MKAKTYKRADGGKVKAYDAEGSNVEKEANERKRGGRVKHEKKAMQERKVEGEKAKHRLDRPKRASGGRVGSDKSPFTSAQHETEARGHKATS